MSISGQTNLHYILKIILIRSPELDPDYDTRMQAVSQSITKIPFKTD